MREYNGIINISEPDNDYSIYKMYSSNEKDNSIYIGVTKDYKQRVYKHSKDKHNIKNAYKPLYVWMNEVIDNQERNIIFEVIENSLTENDAFEKEIIYIQNYKDLGYSVLNSSEGGKGNKGNIPWNKGRSGHLSEKQLQSLSNSHIGNTSGHKGKKHTEESILLITLKNKERKDRGWINPRKKKVYKYNKDRVLLVTYSCLEEAGTKENVSPTSVGEWCRQEKRPNNDFIWSYVELV